MKKIRILQHERYGLGNFINMTPSIKWLYEKNNEKVDVYFSTDYVKECFLKSPYINILNNSTGTFDFSSNMVNKEIEDYKYILGKIHMLEACQQELSRLLEQEEKIDD